MDIFINSHLLPLSTLISINRVRCYLQVLALSDITTGDGSRISQCYLLGDKGSSCSTWIWHEEHPTPADFHNWRTIVRSIPSDCGVLSHPVGPWLRYPHLSSNWFYCPISDHLYHQQGAQWTCYHRRPSRTRSAPTFILHGNVPSPPSTLHLATIHSITSTSVIYESSSAPPPTCPHDPFSSRSTQYAWLLRHCDNPDALETS